MGNTERSTPNRLSVCSAVNPRYISTYSNPLYFQVTNILLGEPLKKKKRIDPQVIKMREDRKRKKLEKQIKRLERIVKQLKPIYECEVPVKLIEEKEKRLRKVTVLSPEEIDRRALLQKEWCRYKLNQWLKDSNTINSILLSQEKALKELKAESEELYQKAIEFDESFLPYSVFGPVNTPAIPDYEAPDGAYTDISIKYIGET
ncbi:mitochondrial ribosomal protein L40 isoform X2 [Nomia melanderi]|uniref:mitochondrial ribosomal protein L40 isoform X2 n=1 Tax=Nomia melanderi TaxID=2448451 RepID=UPI00130407C7|nr:39S ribosomal protein L40, mitochondrial isoform X2 [Nomia melanderi]